MNVSLSPFFGVAGQLFSNDGVPLAGGKIYSYLAGSSTPQATYTTSAGNIAHSNPIILDAAGRVPSGEIWLVVNVSYKFIVRDASDNLIGSFDNVVGVTSKTSQSGYVVATEGQTIVTVPFTYTVGQNSLNVYVNGSKQIITLNYTETNTTSVTFVSGLNVGDVVQFV
jgi:hypothetical protein